MNKEARGPLDPTPGDVSFTDSAGKPHKLEARGDDARFESEAYDSNHDVNGDLKARIGSETVTVSVRSR